MTIPASRAELDRAGDELAAASTSLAIWHEATGVAGTSTARDAAITAAADIAAALRCLHVARTALLAEIRAADRAGGAS